MVCRGDCRSLSNLSSKEDCIFIIHVTHTDLLSLFCKSLDVTIYDRLPMPFFFSPSLISYFLHICFFLWGLVSWPYCQRLLDCNMPCIRISKALHSIGEHERVLHVLWNNKWKQRKRSCSSLPCYFEHMFKMLTY